MIKTRDAYTQMHQALIESIYTSALIQVPLRARALRPEWPQSKTKCVTGMAMRYTSSSIQNYNVFFLVFRFIFDQTMYTDET